MNIRFSLLALSALSLPAVAQAQYAPPVPQPNVVHRPAVAEPWMAQPPPIQSQNWQSPAVPADRSTKLEPIDLPPAIEQGVDMIYIDEELVPRAVKTSDLVHAMSFDDWSGAPVDLFTSVNPIYTELRRGLVKYQQR